MERQTVLVIEFVIDFHETVIAVAELRIAAGKIVRRTSAGERGLRPQAARCQQTRGYLIVRYGVIIQQLLR